MKLSHTAPVPLLIAAFALGACGGDDKSAEQAEANVTPAEAIQEIGQVRSALGTAVDQVRSGDSEQAEETVAEAYLQHFEKVEGPLEEADHELNEKLEETISGDLRDQIKRGASAAEVKRLVDGVNADLDAAEAALR